MSLLELVNVLLRHRRVVFGVAAAVTIVVIAAVILQQRTYTSRAAFIPEVSESDLSFAPGGLVAQLGLGGGSGTGPQFYAALLTSRPVLERAVETSYPVASDTSDVAQVTLLDVYAPDADDPRERRRAKAVRELERDLDTSVDVNTSIVELEVKANDPLLAQGVAARLLELVNEFDSNRRRAQADEEASFLRSRVQEARQELVEAETELEQFLSRNREVTNSPQLTLQRDRLERAVAMRQGIYNSLAQNYESLRIEQARTTPFTAVLTPPQIPAMPNARGLIPKTALAVLAGLLLGMVVAVLRERILRTRIEDPHTFAEFRRLLREAAGDLRHPVRGVVGTARSGGGGGSPAEDRHDA